MAVRFFLGASFQDDPRGREAKHLQMLPVGLKEKGRDLAIPPSIFVAVSVD
jgi:hypothetical protein